MINYKNETKILYKPNHNPNKNWVKEIDPRTMDSNLNTFKAPKNDKRLVTLCRPFVALSKTSYSTPVTLPLGLAYVAAVLEKAGYNTNIIDATGEQNPIKIRRSRDDAYNVQGLSSSEIIERINPETFVFGISLMFTQEWVLHKPFIEEVKKKKFLMQ